MLLNHLSNSNKEDFIELAYKMAYSNKDFPDVQQRLLSHYKEECDISIIPNTATTDELLAHFSRQSDEVKKIVYYEIYMLLISDGKIDTAEQQSLEKMRSALNIPVEDAVKIQEQCALIKQANLDLQKLLGL
ncbi:MAG: hypothetical protein IKE58_05865 [Blautia sp.]|nr:hypothetical protein [Blautia sp.]